MSKRLRVIRFFVICIVFIVVILIASKKWTTISEKDYKDEKEDIIKEIDKNEDNNKDKLEDNEESTHKSENESDSEIISIPVEEAYLKDGRKIAFLTFDDGPSKNTIEILKILDEKNVKATFFVLGKLAEKNKDIIKDINDNGHGIGNHTYSHNYSKIYSSINNLLNEINRTHNILSGILGEEFNSRLFRFPGGSFGEKKSSFRTSVLNNGYSYIDWNVLNRDAEGSNINANELVQNIKDTAKGKERAVILMHDSHTKRNTVDALADTIDFLKSEGYEFAIFE